MQILARLRIDRGGVAANTVRMTMVFWLAVLLLVDASIGLWGLNVWQQLAPNHDIKTIAFWEALAALTMLIIYFMLGRPA